jgi:hypothetical protein
MPCIVAVLSLQAQIYSTIPMSRSGDTVNRRPIVTFDRDLGSRRRGPLIYASFCRYGLSEDHIATTLQDINRFRIAALRLDDYAAGLAYMAGLAHDAGQSTYDLFKDCPQSPA